MLNLPSSLKSSPVQDPETGSQCFLWPHPCLLLPPFVPIMVREQHLEGKLWGLDRRLLGWWGDRHEAGEYIHLAEIWIWRPDRPFTSCVILDWLFYASVSSSSPLLKGNANDTKFIRSMWALHYFKYVRHSVYCLWIVSTNTCQVFFLIHSLGKNLLGSDWVLGTIPGAGNSEGDNAQSLAWPQETHILAMETRRAKASITQLQALCSRNNWIYNHMHFGD